VEEETMDMPKRPTPRLYYVNIVAAQNGFILQEDWYGKPDPQPYLAADLDEVRDYLGTVFA